MATPHDERPGSAEAIITGRRSVRSYSPRTVDRSTIEALLRLATCAPSAHNRQPWRFVVLTDATRKETLARAMGDRLRRDRLADGDATDTVERDVARSFARITGAPVLVLACMTLTDMDAYPDARRRDAERHMAAQSVAMAVQNLLLAAQSAGLGACWMCAPLFCPDVVQSSLDLPRDWEPQALVTLGYPHGERAARARKRLEEVTRFLDPA